MNRYIYHLTVLAGLITPTLGFALDEATPCQAKGYAEIIQCAERSSAEIKISEQQLKAANELEGAAKQWINPELDAESVSKGERSETTASLFFTFRLGGKRSALLAEARSEIEKSQAGRNLDVSHARLEFMLSLYRLAHLKSEIQVEEESVATFTKIVGQFQRRRALSPEQDVSLSVFKMALADHQLRLTRLKADEEKLYRLLTASTGLSKTLIASNLPSRKQTWPVVEGSVQTEDSPHVKKALAELKLAKSQKDKADSEAWPDLKIGPTVKTAKEETESTTFVGFGLSLPLPLFTQNGGNRAFNTQKVAQAEMELNQTRRKIDALRAELVNRYNQTIQSLKSSLSLSIVHQKHEELERQFFKGLVPSSLVIEAHRQLFDLEERRNSSELEALEAFGQVLIIDNKFEQVIL